MPEFNDSYLRDLGKFLTDRGYRVVRLGPLSFRLRYIFRLKKWFTNIVYPLSYLTFADLIRSIFTKFSVTINDNDLVNTKDLKILNILANNEMVKENRLKTYLDYLLLFYSYRNLSSIVKGNVSIIYPFENQPWEKMLNLAFVKLNRIAYQHSTIPFNWLDYRVSRYEEEIPVPRVILTSGKKWSVFLRDYYKESIIEEAGAIRFSYLFNMVKRQEKITNHQAKCIVVALPMSPSISISLQRQLLKCLDKIGLTDYIIKIKTHPYLPKSAYLKDAFSQHKNCRSDKASINELFKDCALMITSGSTVAFESILSGVKTLYFIPEEVSLGLEHFIKEYIFIAYEENFLEKFEEALKSPQYPKVNIEEYFSQPDYNVFLRHL